LDLQQGLQLDNDNTMEEQLQQHIDFITEDLQNICMDAQQNIGKAQEKQKRYYDQGVKTEKFNIGDKVLLYESAKAKVHGDKFREKWTGPYYIHDTTTTGIYTLKTLEEKVLKRKENTDRLKRYHGRPIWKLQIII